jgi:hypothetical protein
MEDLMKAKIIFVWIGESLPTYAQATIDFASKTNDVILASTNRKNSRIIGVKEHYYISPQSISNQKQKFRVSKKYTGDFWYYTSLRLFYVREVAKQLKLEAFFHGELDNMFFSLGELAKSCDNIGLGFFAPIENEERGLASILYINKLEAYEEFLKLFNTSNPPDNDMVALGRYYLKSRSDFYCLPTESFGKIELKNQIHPNYLGGIVDGECIGMYLFGLDPKLRKCRINRNGYIIKHCLIDLKACRFRLSDGNLFMLIENKWFKVYNVHIHSKRMDHFIQLFKNRSKLISRLNSGKTSIISGKRYLIPFLSLMCAKRRGITDLELNQWV